MIQDLSLQRKMFEELQDESLYQLAIDAGNSHLETVNERAVSPTDSALENLNHFLEDMPRDSTNPKSIIEHLAKFGGPATVATVGGRYFGFVTGSVVPAGLAAKLLATFWDQNAGLEVLSPITARLETVVENWLRQIFNLPKRVSAGFITGSSAANFCGLAAARFRVLNNLGWDINEQGLFNAPKVRVVTGREAHSTVIKAINLLGFGKGNIEWVDVDGQGRIIPEAMPPLDKGTIVILQAGNVNSGSFDPMEEICKKAREAGAWVHIDGAFGLWAGAVQKLKHLTKGMELANSWAVDGHKTLNTPYDSGIVLCDDKEAIISAMHMSGAYIMAGQSRDGMYYTPDMSRRSRVIELWATLKYLGRTGVEQMVWTMHERALEFAQEFQKAEGFEVLNEVVFNQVLVCCADDELTEKVIAKIQDLRDCWVGGSTWKGKRVIRISVSSWATTSEDVQKSVASFKKALELVQS